MTFEVLLARGEDLEEINKLIWSPGIKWFGNIRPKYRGKESLFQNYQSHRLVARVKATSDLVAYAEFRNYPGISALPSDCWMEWLSVRYCLTFAISWLNALFCNFCIYKHDHPCVIAEIINEVFYMENRVWYLIAVKTPNVRQPKHFMETFDDLEELSKVFYPREYCLENNNNTQSLYIVDRFELLPKITYRKALAEDNDDIIAIQEVEIPELRKELGDFYIAEVVMSQSLGSEKDILIVGEMSNNDQDAEIYVFMWLSTDIDIRFYVQNYEVGAYGNLVKSADGRSCQYEALTVYSINRRAPVSMFTTDALTDLYNVTILGGLQRVDSCMSVASAGKIKMSSIRGTIVDDEKNNFYIREVLHSKFKYIINKLTSNEYYMQNEPKYINFVYPTGVGPSGPKDIEAASNVFLLKCIVAREGFPLPRLFNCLVATFCAYPEKDYCILLVQKKNRNIRSHVEVLSYFMPVMARPTSVSDLDEMYITHRSTIFGEISIYEMTKDDMPVVLSLAIGNMSEKNHTSLSSENASVTYCSKVNERAELEHELRVLEDIMMDVLENEFSEFLVFTIRCGNSTKSIERNTPIGYVVLRQFHSHSKLFDHYHLPRQENHLDHLRAEIISLRLHPLFLVSSAQIFRDLARKTNFFDFYFISSFKKSKFGNDLKKMMMVLEPRPIKKAPVPFKDHIEVMSSTAQLNIPKPNFDRDYLIIYRHRLKPNKWFTNSKKIVIIGFTPMTKAFLRRLIFQWNTKDFSNANNYTCLSWPEVTVICNPGVVEAEYDDLFVCPYCAYSRDCYLSYQNVPCYIRDCCARMDMRYWVNFIPGRVQLVNRQKKFVKANACDIYYDSLLLMCARMFVLRVPSSEVAIARPCNFVEVNCQLNKLMLFHKLRALLEDMPNTYHIVVYGNNLSTYECVTFLISHGVESSRIVCLQPHRSTGNEMEAKLKSPYWDTNLQYILNDILADSGVKVLEDYKFHHWVLHESGDFIRQVVFQHFPRRHRVSYECDIFISFEEGYMAPQNKIWIQSAGIDMEGDDILVNERYQTNDPNIYAAGNYIKLRRECNYQYKFVSQRETARKLLHHLGIAPINKFEDRFSEPLHFQARLPLNYFITKITLPRRFLASTSSTFAYKMTTYKDNTFCRVVLSQTMVVEEIVVVTKLECYLDFLQHFCGKHELLLNNLNARYKANTIQDFLMWFQEAWAELIMHENFDELQVENRGILKTMAVAAQNKNVNRGPFQDVTDQDFYVLNKRYVEQRLLNFLREHRAEFKHKFALPEDFVAINPFSWNPGTEETDASTETSEQD
ncbi:cilia- and flagella-associated protein 61 isoform X1 [Drosophila kikkawai]|uniref:Cilia- and flagella-associated protein 61 isoform X1 n=3 Tax=Drosophila kikkawai TaxID=30033 RepID=A0A6P4I8T0_DROKI|nr:cilia- and flagella-associated protein 61 isoform X1 [Drosophila kikkawai]